MLTCGIIGTEDNMVLFCPCPYEQEMSMGDIECIIMAFLCNNCYGDRCDEI